MPELPEVETVVRDLRPLLAGRTITGVRHSKQKLRRPWKTAWNAEVAGKRIEGIRRRGKWILIDLAEEKKPNPPSPLSPALAGPVSGASRGPAGKEGGGASSDEPRRPLGGKTSHTTHTRDGSSNQAPPPSFPAGPQKAPLTGPARARERGDGGVGSSAPLLRIHLGMTGQFTVVPASEPEPDHLHVVFSLNDDKELRFRDQRRFGSAEYFLDRSAVEAEMNAELGPEPFGLDANYFQNVVCGTSRNLKAVLLDQKTVAGVGNIYADEACFRAKLHPGRTGKSLTVEECGRLREAIESVLTRAIESRGSTIRDYVGGSGLRGGFQNEFAVYGRTDQACSTCATAIQCTRYAGRASHFCPTCQPLAVGRKRSKAKPKTRKRESA